MTKQITCLLIITAVLSGCLKKIRYEPSQIDTFFKRKENIQLEFTTDKGRQVAFYIPPSENQDSPPSQIGILYGGIESVALDWQHLIKPADISNTGYLLIDYPGRGLSDGMMRPETNYLNSEGALEALARLFGLSKLDAELNLLGHSFGTGAALQFASLHPVKRIVLVAPFTTLRKAVAVRSWLLSIIIPAQIDNRKIISRLMSSGRPPEITILHGAEDTSLPVEMGRELAAIDPKGIAYYEFSREDHTSILTNRRGLIFGRLNGRR